MDLSRNVIKRFVEVAAPTKVTSNDVTVYGTITGEGDQLYVKIDGSEVLTPITSSIDVREGDRVLVLIKNHEAMVIGSPTSPTARLEELRNLEGEVTEFGVILADKVGTGELVAMQALIEELEAKDVTITGRLDANDAKIETLTAENVDINGKLTAYQAEIEELETKKLSAEEAEIKYATIENLEVTNQKVDNLEGDYADFKVVNADKFTAIEADIEDLDTKKLSAEEAEVKYANIDFANIGKAAIEAFFSKSGMIGDLVVGDGTITGKLVGVTITGDLIEGNTVKADKLVVKGSDGLYYKLNFEGGTFKDGETVPTDSLHGSVITAKSITAEKVSVKDLVAFDATIGGFNITDTAIYSGAKETVDNTTRGIYLDSDGQMAVGDSNNFIKFYKDQNGDYKLEISMVSALKDQLDNLEIGGRNLIRNSTTLMFEDYYFSSLSVSHDDDGNVVVEHPGVTVSYDNDGNVSIDTGLTASSDNDGNVTLT